jgi:hypothetical protein
MFRRIATFVLLVPLSLNGLWMVCAEAPVEAASTPATEPSEQCKKMCPIHQAQSESTQLAAADADSGMQPGAICVISSDGTGTSIAAFAFAVTAPAAVVAVAEELIVSDSVSETVLSYADPPLMGLTPPPKA